MADSKARLIQGMQNASFYSHPVQEPIQMVQTHASYVFLTGQYAYKVKKSVDFGFFDYSTLEKRHHFLQEELRLNSVIAPDIYIEVLPIFEAGNEFSLEGDESPVEYSLKMRQFPQACLLSEMYKKGTLNSDYMRELGEVVAQFHQQAKQSPEIQSYGTINAIKPAFDENYQQTEKYIGEFYDMPVQTQQQYQETKQFTDSFFSTKIDLLQDRKEGNFIRECHGDLHLKNICYWQNKIQLFDRIEFNKAFRFVDVMYDVAFAVMDLDAKDCPALGNVFLNTYLEHTGDWEGVQVLPLYLSRQAYVRAKVTSFLLDDAQVPDSEKQKAAQTAQQYYHLAYSYTQRNPGKLYVMCGISGTGKSVVGGAIAQQTQAIHIRTDAVRKHLAGIGLKEKGNPDIYRPEMSQATYARLAELGKLLVEQGFTVVLDGKYDRLTWRTPLLEYAQSTGTPVRFVHCTAPMGVLRDRLQTRQGDISDATTDLLTQQQNQAEAFQDREKPYTVTVDTSKPWDVDSLLS
ncbi:AAA family ATPase [Spirulina sp. CS-785/01]|uniref:bifunctional aminoglycoside phosphotransferase/ATP-binding protein n=1 Tax=Spirulina sp. CS-785/01 TaxID=3021716 RepID=UPI00232DC3FE|nr:bifunctional aminoglycoside phosphotransferase/ATP-binding protein [Spirulina sp. CS-785/01]MDB9314829.1 AAA family ATPase [Spirulina sp. CS-785/01]